jgi:hypothetical protein
VVGVVGKDGGINAPSSDGGGWTWPVSGCGVPLYTVGAAGSCCWALRLEKKNNIREAAETATTPPVTPPAMVPLLEEEPPEVGEEDEVEETVD